MKRIMVYVNILFFFMLSLNVYAGVDKITLEADALPNITAITPAFGGLQGGTSVLITGTDFTGATAVKFGSTAASSFKIISATQIRAISPAGTVGVKTITVTTPSGTSIGNTASRFTYALPPVITSVSPNDGPVAGGTSVKIDGSNFDAVTGVKFGSTPATSFSTRGSQITAISPPGTGAVNITLLSTAGNSVNSAADVFTYVVPPTVTGISPNVGITTGGTRVTITGTNFTGTKSVKWGATLASSFTVISDTKIEAESPGASNGSIVHVYVTTAGGKSADSDADKFLFINKPAVTSVSPNSGLSSGGTKVNINGLQFRSVTGVNFGSTPATSFTVVNGFAITAIAPPGVGTVDITVTTVVGTSPVTEDDQYTYWSNPTVSSLTPNKGPLSGGTSVTITGTHLKEATAVKFGSTPATSFNIISDTQILAVSPPGTDTVNVTVTTPGGTSITAPANTFTYSLAPIVSWISPTEGPESGGTSVSITGKNFLQGATVQFGAAAATSVTVISDTALIALSPPGNGIVDVSVSTVGGTSSNTTSDQFTYISAPIITSISPPSGPSTGGTVVTITGRNFKEGLTVNFGSQPAASITFVSSTQIIATSPAGTGTVDIVVTTQGGTSTKTPATQFTYAPPLNGIFAGTASGSVYYSTDNGRNWIKAAALNGSEITSIAALRTIVYAGTENGQLFYSLNAGSSWAAMSLPDASMSPVKSLFASNNSLYVGLGNGKVYLSTNNGNSWKSLVSPSGTSAVRSLFVASPTTLYAGSDNGSVYYSTNGGSSWVAINGKPDTTAVTAIFVAKGLLYVGTAREYVYTSTALTGGGAWGAPIAQTVFRLWMNADASNMLVGMQRGHVFSLTPQKNLGFIAYTPITAIFGAFF